MEALKRVSIRFLPFLVILLLASCNNESPTQTLPQGCQAQGIYAIDVLESGLTCAPTNAFADPAQALGASNARATGPGKLEFEGFVSLGVSGSLTFYLGSCVQDLSGPDLRVYQFVADESVELQVSQSTGGPFVSLGTEKCGNRGGPVGFCDFDLAGTGLNNIRVVKIVDQSKVDFADAHCDNVGPSPGADIDAVEVLHPGS